mmetsp:Transcript_91383/g.143464  ORF Transcript_91383/g.143464 Transcript_91383/m.143464 type:complete len:142 (+) Transcript_91383:83-508(+)
MALVAPTQVSSAVVNAPADAVFELVKPLTFKFLSTVSKVDPDADGETLNVCYADNTIQKIRKLEYSALEKKVTWEVIESEPAAPTFSTIHSITCESVTTTGQCFIKWSTDFSNDVTSAVIEDSKWKKDDAFKQLSNFVVKA